MANATENVETSCVVYPILELVMKISHVCEVCGVTYEGGAGVGTLVCPKCREEEMNELERIFGPIADCSDPADDSSLFGP